MNGMCVLIKEASENYLPLLPCEDIWGESAICKPEGEISPGTESVSASSLDTPASRMVGNKRLLFRPPSLQCFVIAA